MTGGMRRAKRSGTLQNMLCAVYARVRVRRMPSQVYLPSNIKIQLNRLFQMCCMFTILPTVDFNVSDDGR